jgi:hypothetical protein
MKDITIEAKVPANKEKGTKEMHGTATVQFAENLDEARKAYGEEAILTNALANWKVTLQSNIRAGLKRGETPEQIAARLKDAKMGVAQTGAKVDPVQAYLAKFASATPEEQQKMLADLKKRAQK